MIFTNGLKRVRDKKNKVLNEDFPNILETSKKYEGGFHASHIKTLQCKNYMVQYFENVVLVMMTFENFQSYFKEYNTEIHINFLKK